ncbi:Uncharacterised protein [Streptococcus pyogenes]|nr:Uncharacterised protein [Streptococcus pyogenes]VGW45689.1 Uncharacterised protein [Streptococcus pyogenes]VGZ75220.1 Uncharacterised protein [Streptococcus pyogenes]VHA44863.1 Uncharacterised protein [Streptococcus pyogenes]VHA78837.1 Uncharacterised protein [Streptococcus pyogenes]
MALSSLRNASFSGALPRRLVKVPPFGIIRGCSIGESTADTVEPTNTDADTATNPKADLRKKHFTFISFPIVSPFLFLYALAY